MDIYERIQKIERMTYGGAERLLFEWIKTGVINLKEFRQLNETNRNSSY